MSDLDYKLCYLRSAGMKRPIMVPVENEQLKISKDDIKKLDNTPYEVRFPRVFNLPIFNLNQC